jgi:hypothetical protein
VTARIAARTPLGGLRGAVRIESFDNLPRAAPAGTEDLAGDPSFAGVRREMRDMLLDAVILQDHPHPPRGLFAQGVH